jgi:hypothetical protein
MLNRFDIFKEILSSGYVNVDWAINNILNIKKQEFRKEKIKRIFNDQARKI